MLGMLAMSRQWYYPWQVSVVSHNLAEVLAMAGPYFLSMAGQWC